MDNLRLQLSSQCVYIVSLYVIQICYQSQIARENPIIINCIWCPNFEFSILLVSTFMIVNSINAETIIYKTHTYYMYIINYKQGKFSDVCFVKNLCSL